MANNKVVLSNGTTLIDLTDATATADKILEGYTAYGANGQKIIGTASGQSILITDTTDSHGGTIRTITGKVVQLQTKTITPTSSVQVVDPDTGYDGFSQVTVNASESAGKNVQAYRGYATVTATSYTATAVTLTVAKTGTYNVSWMGYRNTNTGTSGSQLYKNGTAVGSASTTFVNTYGHSVSLTNQSFTQGDVLVVRARARSTSYIMGVGNLIIEEV